MVLAGWNFVIGPVKSSVGTPKDFNPRSIDVWTETEEKDHNPSSDQPHVESIGALQQRKHPCR